MFLEVFVMGAYCVIPYKKSGFSYSLCVCAKAVTRLASFKGEGYLKRDTS